MHAAVLDHADRAVLRAHNHDRRRTDIRADEVAGIGNFRLERDVVPGRTMENALDLAPVDALVGVDPVRDLGEVAGPDILPVEQHRSVACAAGSNVAVPARLAHAGVRVIAAHVASDAIMQDRVNAWSSIPSDRSTGGGRINPSKIYDNAQGWVSIPPRHPPSFVKRPTFPQIDSLTALHQYGSYQLHVGDVRSPQEIPWRRYEATQVSAASGGRRSPCRSSRAPCPCAGRAQYPMAARRELAEESRHHLRLHRGSVQTRGSTHGKEVSRSSHSPAARSFLHCR